MINKETRDGKAVAQTDCLFYSLHKDDLERLNENFPDFKIIFVEQARKKKESHLKRKADSEKRNPYYGRLMEGANFFVSSKLQKFVNIQYDIVARDSKTARTLMEV